MAKPNEIDAPDEGKTLSRRELLPLAGKTAVGVAGLGVLASGGLALGCGGDADDDSGAATTGGSAEWPWPYRQLAVADSQPIAYDSWYDKFCCYAVVNAIFGPLKDKVGAPYTAFPNAATKWGHGGAVGWGTLCGTLTGAGIVTGLIAGEIGESILNDVINWYTVTELPVYRPSEPRTEINSTSTSDSPLCHISVGKWMAKENVAFFSNPRMERCARLSADVAGKTIELINQWVEGSYKPVAAEQARAHPVQMPAQNNCAECHGESVPASPGEV
jgi:hypothetical protein